MKRSRPLSSLNRMSKWQYAILLLIVFTFSFYSLPSFFGERPALGLHYPNAWSQHDQLLLKQHEITPDLVETTADKTLLVFHSQSVQQKAKQVLELNGYHSADLTLEYHANSPKWMQTLGAEPIRLGLDLRGGSQLLLRVDAQYILQSHLSSQVENLREALKMAGLRGGQISVQKETLRVTMPSEELATPWLKVFREQGLAKSDQWQMHLDGNLAIFAIPETEKMTLVNNGVTQNMAILKKRLEELGIVEAVVQRQGTEAIRIELPGVHNPKQAKDVIGATATLAFHAVKSSGPYLLADKHKNIVSMARQPVLTGQHITDARANSDEFGRPQVSISLDRIGGQKMMQFSKTNIGQPMATVFTEYKSMSDGTMHASSEVINVATIQSTLGNQFRISGIDNTASAQELAILLRAGALTAPLKIIEERSIGPTLGQENIQAGFTALAFGMTGMMVFMVIWYRRFGWISIVGLLANLLMQVGLLALLPGAVLTLPGIAGLVLTVGMAVDTNVLIFERIKDRLRDGGSIANAIDFGYRSAFVTIFDANITTLISAVILYGIGSGPLQGFAITLILGLLSSMVTGIWGTRAMINPIWGQCSVKLLKV